MKKAVIIILVLALLGGGGYYAWATMNGTEDYTTGTSEETTELADEAEPAIEEDEVEATNEVSYTDDGFSPATITVEAGTKVTWTNESNADMWVGSDPHPVHTDFSAFDQKSTGNSYSFTFDEAGTYEYHNHQNSGDTGTVVVK